MAGNWFSPWPKTKFIICPHSFFYQQRSLCRIRCLTIQNVSVDTGVCVSVRTVKITNLHGMYVVKFISCLSNLHRSTTFFPIHNKLCPKDRWTWRYFMVVSTSVSLNASVLPQAADAISLLNVTDQPCVKLWQQLDGAGKKTLDVKY